jgi:hypothetical protein
VFAENEQEFEEASPEVKLHGHSVGAASKPSAFPEHSFSFSEDTCRLFGPHDRVHLRRAYTTTPPRQGPVEVEDNEDDNSESSDEDEAPGFGVPQHRHPTQ